MKSFGICLGASSIKTALISKSGTDPIKVVECHAETHESNPRSAFTSIMKDSISVNDVDYCLVTGRKFREIVDLPSITEPEALEAGLHLLRQTGKLTGTFDAIVSLGAESFLLYTLNKDFTISAIETGNKCASGTGEFFLQQIRRMDLSIDQAVEVARGAEPYRVSGRCSVFCKSDCTHALNKGIPAGRVTAGLCGMITGKVLDLLEKSPGSRIIAVGGVTKNSVIMEMLRKEVDQLVIPEYADCFEALGAAYQAFYSKTEFERGKKSYFTSKHSSFQILPPLNDAGDLVVFESIPEKAACNGDELILGLDVGSTTTKAVALRINDNAIVAKTYLRTNGNPIAAARECYKAISSQIQAEVTFVGLGTTGSGRQIAGLHAGTDSVINEIIAHATAAAYFDPDVETIFEIGGQDAKYTYLVNGVPSDYAMNEACSAGTGSFLEESAKESMGIDYRKIQEIAVKGMQPPNFNDQCAAFISSDIKTAGHEGIGTDDIVAGLVYSICMNYVNRVKGRRPVGKKVLMQGGVCYNKAVPLAMANLIHHQIIVPPEPGLMGAFGVALEVKNRITNGLSEKKLFNPAQLASRDVEYGKPFVCHGGTSKCDRGCEIAMIIIDDKKFPFGGACNKYYNLIHHLEFDSSEYDFVHKRETIVFNYEKKSMPASGPRIGMNRSFLMHTLYPLYETFFRTLGAELIISDSVDPVGIKRKRSAFCYPAEISHGAFRNLIQKKPDFIFLPSVVELYVDNALTRRREHQCTCMILQGEPYYLKSAFKDIDPGIKILSPILDFSQGLDTQEQEFVKVACEIGRSEEEGRIAYRKAVEALRSVQEQIKNRGRDVLAELEKNPEKTAIVLFGRYYNAFASEANMGIPEKFASRGITLIPWDYLPYQEENVDFEVNWAIGQNLMKAAKFVARHPQLFAAYITNFSCGPDSFLLTYFRDYMEAKPSLTLELDSHTADAGINTRIEAFWDIIERFRKIGVARKETDDFTPAEIKVVKKRLKFISSDGTSKDLRDDKIQVLLPSMGKLNSEVIAAALKGGGIKADAVPVYDRDALRLGRANTTCKECLPLILTTGGLLKHIEKRTNKDEKVAYFMPTCGGNCRFTQYNVFLEKLIKKNKIPDTALLTMTNENGYAGFDLPDQINILKGVILAECMEDIKNNLRVLARDYDKAMNVYENQWQRILNVFIEKRGKNLFKALNAAAEELSAIKLRYPLKQAKTVSLLGEIFVRSDYFSCQDLIERLAVRDIVVKRAPLLEWLNYCDYNVKEGIYEARFDLMGFLEFQAKRFLQAKFEKSIKTVMAKSGLYNYEPVNVNESIRYGTNFFNIRFTGEAILVAGSFFKDIFHSIHGAISIGPFACMPTRVIEAVMTAEATMDTARKINAVHQTSGFHEVGNLPFLTIESDGNPFPQILEARIEAFCLQVERFYERRNKNHGSGVTESIVMNEEVAVGC
ncbi:MAG TPA: acyl-CoA dehydratase activase [Chitinispirillaceae bacterium]|nr:acyl-CoA dehydratase activase [Chitinispirillaceae bacterium]